MVNKAVVWGIPTVPGENVLQLVEKILLYLGLREPSELVASAERIFVNTKASNELVPIRIVFHDSESKEAVINKKKQFGKLLSTAIDKTFNVNGNRRT